jgi:hypothetical protein
MANNISPLAATAALIFAIWSMSKPAVGSPIIVASNSYELQASLALRVSSRFVVMPGSLESTLFVKPSPRHKDVGRRFRYPYRVGDPELCEPTRRARRTPALLAARMDFSTSRTRLVLHPAPLELVQHVRSRRKTGPVALIVKTT